MNIFSKNMFNLKFGFTLAEGLIVLGIIGVLTGAAISVMKPFDRTTKYLYTNAEISLDRAYYNAMGVGGLSDPFNANTDGHRVLCEALIRYINPVERDKACKAPAMSPDATTFTNDNIQFTAVNGMRFYISDMVEGVANGSTIRFYLVFVDINGEKGSGSIEYIPHGATDASGKPVKAKTPDVFAFAVLPINRVVPLGPPEVDTQFMTTRISFFDNNQNNTYTTVSKPYYQTKADAWGYYLGKKLDEDGNETEEFAGNDGKIEVYNPFTYNDAIRTILSAREDNIIYQNVVIPNTTRDAAYVAPSGAYGALNPTSSSPQCANNTSDLAGAVEACKLHIDNYAY